MCGFAGFLGGAISHDRQGKAEWILQQMTGALHHRGPDHEGTWHDPGAGIAMAHNRLAIVELSPAGDQPMFSASGRYVLVYNGEVYNHSDLRRELQQAGAQNDWRGHSDTETLLAAIEHWGVKSALQRTIGMFAFALWDSHEKALILSRDRIGEKPLYYGWQGSSSDRTYLFASELKPMLQHPSFSKTIDRGALSQFMRLGYVPGDQSIYMGIHKLDPGCIATLRDGAEPEVTNFWSAPDEIAGAVSQRYAGTVEEAVESLEQLLLKAVGSQMMADVPLGAFLSGGIDSSTIVAMMQAQSSRPVKTFSIGFYEEGYNEANHALAVANHLGTDHTELYVTADEAMSVLRDLPTIYDEPFADASQIPTFLVSKLARSKVKVSLSGDAGDELFAGYNRYGLTERLWTRMSVVPRPLRRVAASALTRVAPGTWNNIARAGQMFLPSLGRMPNPGFKIHKGAGVMASRSVAELYHGVTSHWIHPGDIVIGGRNTFPNVLEDDRWPVGLSDVERMMATDLITYLPDDILVKVDRAAMAVSLETRVPFLDHRVVDFAWRLPLSLKLRGGKTKWLLRQVLYRYVPPALVERPKMGFGLPIDEWLRGPLRSWAEELLDERRLRDEGFFRPEPIRKMWELHQSGRADVQYQLWDALMFQSWLEAQTN